VTSRPSHHNTAHFTIAKAKTIYEGQRGPENARRPRIASRRSPNGCTFRKAAKTATIPAEFGISSAECRFVPQAIHLQSQPLS
jgi:hypothetical protein